MNCAHFAKRIESVLSMKNVKYGTENKEDIGENRYNDVCLFLN